MTEKAHRIPIHLEPVHAFVNSMDVELGTDAWSGGPAALAAWLVSADLVPPGTPVTEREYALTIELRTGLRAMTLANNGLPADSATVIAFDRVLAQFPLLVRVSAAGGGLAGMGRGGVLGALDRVVAGYAMALVTGEWHRLRRCPAEDCAWVFWDSSARAARRWCTMGVCGNRAKARAYAARRRART